MKNLSRFFIFASLLLAISSLNAATANTYQVTGPVLSVSDTTIVVDKDGDKWEIAGDKATFGSVKVGDKVTIKYQMVAKKVEVKAAPTVAKPLAK